MSISISKNNYNVICHKGTKTQRINKNFVILMQNKKTKKLCAFVPSWQNFCAFVTKSVYLQNGISNWRNGFSWRTFITSFN